MADTPQTLQTDQGANFVSEVFRNTCGILKSNKIQSTAFHPASQGSIERSHRVLAECFRHYVSEDQTNWDSWVPFATYNTTEHSATGFTPFELLFGRPSTLPFALKKPPELHYNYDDYASDLKGRLQTVHQRAHKNLVESKGKSMEHYDKTAGRTKLQVGDKVLLFDETCAEVDRAKYTVGWTVHCNRHSQVNATIARGPRYTLTD